MSVLTQEQLAVLAELDDVWVYFHQIKTPTRPCISRRRMVGVLRGLRQLGLVDTRKSDVSGHVEYAITPAGDEALGR